MSLTLVQHCINVIQMFCVWWESSEIEDIRKTYRIEDLSLYKSAFLLHPGIAAKKNTKYAYIVWVGCHVQCKCIQLK